MLFWASGAPVRAISSINAKILGVDCDNGITMRVQFGKIEVKTAGLLFASVVLMVFGLGIFPVMAQAPKPSDAARIAGIKSIGVISAVGDQINIYTNGFSVFSLSEKYYPLTDMHIDDMLESFVRKKIDARFKIVPVTYDREEFSKSSEPGFMSIAAPPPVAELVKTLSAPVDAYLIISKAKVPLGVREDILRAGLNMGRGGEATFTFYSFVNVSLFDAQTHTLLAQTVYPAPISPFWGGTVAFVKLDGSLWPDDSGNFTATQHDALKDLFFTTLARIVGGALGQIGLSSPANQ